MRVGRHAEALIQDLRYSIRFLLRARTFTATVPGRNVNLNPSYYSHGFYEHLRASRPLFRNLIASSTAVSSGVNLTDGAVRLVASFLYGVTPSHPGIVAGVLVLLIVVGLSAGVVPARNAALTDPCSALRQD
jgi:hypothetical protein